MRESELFASRAAAFREQAETADLANVRERCLRAEAAWMAMANRALGSERARAERDTAAEAAPVAR